MSDSASSLFAAHSRLRREPAAFGQALAGWFAAQRRTLPWREQPEAYKTVVSELMLQQTQVVTALPYFERWVARWPDFTSLAAADEAQVLQMWEGLGYYSRARNLLKLARAWAAAAAKPQTAQQWLQYPGVGPYTAAAIASIAFNEHTAVVDGNVVRILTRLCNDNTAYTDPARAVRAVTELAQHLIEHASHPGTHNEAMMELGATLCRKGQPQCLLCPVAAFCDGRALGADVAELPKIARKAAVNRVVSRVFALDRAGASVLLCRYATDARRLAGLCELPLWEDCFSVCAATDAADSNNGGNSSGSGNSESGAAPMPAKPLLTKKRGIANENIEERIYAAPHGLLDSDSGITAGRQTADSDAQKQKTLFWQPLDKLDAVTLTGPHRRWLDALLKKKH